jgi:hypothetical protein
MILVMLLFQLFHLLLQMLWRKWEVPTVMLCLKFKILVCWLCLYAGVVLKLFFFVFFLCFLSMTIRGYVYVVCLFC